MKITRDINDRDIISVPHQGGEVMFATSKFGPSNYNKVGEQIDNAGLLRPTFAETVSLVYAALQNKSNPLALSTKRYANDILDTLTNNWFWTFNDAVYIPEYIPKNFRIHKDTVREFSLDNFLANPSVYALAEGKEGTEKLVKIAGSLGKKPFVRIFGDVDKKRTTVAFRYSDWNSQDSSSDINNLNGGCAFGLSK